MALSKAKLKELRALATKKGRVEERRFLVEGVRLMQEAVGSDAEILEAYYTADLLDQPAGRPLIQKLSRRARSLEQVSARELSSVADTIHAQGIVGVVRQKHTTLESLLRKDDGESVLVAFDAVSDPGNLGTMIRTADWFGVNGIFIGERSVEAVNAKVVRATMGGIFHVPIVTEVDLPAAISRARSAGYTVYVTDQNGETHFDRITYSRKAVIVFGNEAWGVSDHVKSLADIRVAIRRYGAAESLNVSVACGVVLSALHRLYDDER